MQPHDDQPDIPARIWAQAYTLSLGMNVATNGRWFCAMLAAINVAGGNLVLALLATLPVGLAVLVDQIPSLRLRSFASTGVYALTVAVVIFTILKVW